MLLYLSELRGLVPCPNERGWGMRRTILLLAVMAATLVLGSGMALAVTKVGTDGPDRLIGTDEEDNLLGLGDGDYLEGRAAADDLKGGGGEDEARGGDGRDFIVGGRGNDILRGGPGNDHIEADDGFQDLIRCGKGTDTANVDRWDLTIDCETLN